METLLQDIRELFKMLKHKSLSKHPQKFCPACGSKRLELKIKWFIIPIRTYKCPECGYEGPIYMEKEDTNQESRD